MGSHARPASPPLRFREEHQGNGSRRAGAVAKPLQRRSSRPPQHSRDGLEAEVIDRKSKAATMQIAIRR